MQFHEIYCSSEPEVATTVALETQDIPGTSTRQRLDNLEVGDKVTSDNNLLKGSLDKPFCGKDTDNKVVFQ